jgi:hypothetical protein
VTVPAVMNAWAVVDAAYRLGLIVPRLRGLKHGPAVKSFLKSVAPVEPFRHVVQHLDANIPQLLTDCQPVWAACRERTWSRPRLERSGLGCSCPAPPGPRSTCPW